MPHIPDQNSFLEVYLYYTYTIKQSILPNQRRLQKASLHIAKPLHSPHLSCFSLFHNCFLCLAQESSPSQMGLTGSQRQGIMDLLMLGRCEHCCAFYTALDMGMNSKCSMLGHQMAAAPTITSPNLSEGMTWECRSLVSQIPLREVPTPH